MKTINHWPQHSMMLDLTGVCTFVALAQCAGGHRTNIKWISTNIVIEPFH